MLDIIYRCDPENPAAGAHPGTIAEAKRLLEEGNATFARHLEHASDVSAHEQIILPMALSDLGGGSEGDIPAQRPFAAVLSCADARVPVEMIFDQACNALFVTRVAGNVLASECVGSLDYAVSHFPESLRLVVVLGHSGCGAVASAVDTYLNPAQYLALATRPALRLIVDRLLIAVRAAALSLRRTFGEGVESNAGYRAALLELSVVLNAALGANTLRREFPESGVEVMFGVYHLGSRRVGLPGQPGLHPPPQSAEDFARLAAEVAQTPDIAGTVNS